MTREDFLRQIPQVERVLREPPLKDALERGEVPHRLAAAAVREVLEELRARVLAGEAAELGAGAAAARSLARVRRAVAPRLVRVINATGVVLHTNLGRASLAREAVEAMTRAAGYCNVEYDLAAGRRGDRHEAVAGILRELTGAEAALVVNNNAAAVLLCLAALARGRDVIVSRGELVEIGGAFRIPEVMAQSGANCREVGTTNKTHLRDYERAIGPETALLLKVHTSNYRILGFTAEVPLEELVALGRRTGIAVAQDLGSGCLVDLSRYGIEKEPTVGEAVAAGADLITFSGDKLLGGPQAGIMVGRREAVEACARHPLMRALRPDKVTLAALEATLALYRDPERCAGRIPALARLLAGEEELRRRAEVLASALRGRLVERAGVEVRTDTSEAGGGSLPLQRLPTRVVEVRPSEGGAARVEARLRRWDPPVVCRVREEALVFDPRTIGAGEEETTIVEALTWALGFEEEEP